MDALLSSLRTILDKQGIVTDSEMLDPYLKETRGRYKGSALIVARPRNSIQVRNIVLACINKKIPIVPQGGNTGLCGGAVSFPGQLVLSLERMSTIRDIDIINNTITVEAGCILKNIQNFAKDNHRYFPLSLAAEGSCQIGGNLATNAGGINVLRYGNARDQVLGIEAVLPNGEILNELGGLRKNNTGYDLKNLLIGSEGTLGVITAATLELQPYPIQKTTAFIALSSLDECLDFFRVVNQMSFDSLSSFELIPRTCLELAFKHLNHCTDPFKRVYEWHVLMELQTNNDIINLDSLLEQILEKSYTCDLITDAVIAKNDNEISKLWSLREGIVEAQKLEGGSIKHDVSLNISLVPEFIKSATHIVTKKIPGCRVCAFGHLGDGNIHFNITQPENMDKDSFLEKWDEINLLVHDVIQKLNGSFSAEHGIGLSKIKEMSKYKDQTSLNLMRTIKTAIDPLNLFNPGKVIPPEYFQDHK